MAARAWSSLSPGSASSLTSRSVMAEKRELRCVIAAGGTAGHVLPALAVADALQERGVRVSFAGSPDRAKAHLVPEAGYELDTFRSSGLPRRAGVALAIEGRNGPRYRITGRPVPRRSQAMPVAEARRMFDLTAERPVLIVLGGSQGALRLNELAVERWGGEGPAVLHLCGERDYEEL